MIVSRKKIYKLNRRMFHGSTCKCRIKEIKTKYFISDNATHSRLVLDVECIYCHDPGKKWFNHEDDNFVGFCIECTKCHNHIIYVDGNNIYKQELYLDDINIFIISDDEGYDIFDSKLDHDKFIMKTPHFYFDSIERLKEKIKTYIVFS